MTTITKPKKLTKTELLEIENKNIKNQVDDLSKKIDLIISGTGINQTSKIDFNSRIKLTCYILGRNAFVLNKKTIIFPKLGSTYTIGVAEANDLVINEKYKSQLECGLLSFDKNEWYEHFGIIKPIPLNDENFKEILLGNTIYKFNELSQFKKDEIVLHELMYRTAQMIKRHKVKLEWEKSSELEKYFEAKFENLVALIDEIL